MGGREIERILRIIVGGCRIASSRNFNVEWPRAGPLDCQRGDFFRFLMAEARNDRAMTALVRELTRVQQHHRERGADPALARELTCLATWQSRRLRNTYADLESTPRYAAAMRFFETDLYGGADFAQRDANMARVVPAMNRLLPANVIDTVAAAIELNALSQDLDRAMVDELRPRALAFSVGDYCAAYRTVGRFDQRRRQIALMGDVGGALDRFVRKPMVRGALAVMRKPARMAGLAALQDFLERGFAAFTTMRGSAEFLATIQRRETVIHEAIVAGEDAPFPDPMA